MKNNKNKNSIDIGSENNVLADFGLNEQFIKKMGIISFFNAILVFIAALGGLIWESLYRDPIYLTSQAKGQDLITVIFVVPLQIYAIYYTQKNRSASIKSLIIWMGCLLYDFYTYLMYIFLANFNNFFLLYQGIAAVSFYSLIATIMHLDLSETSPFNKIYTDKFPQKEIKRFFIILAVLFYFIWTSAVIPGLIGGYIPEDVELYRGHVIYTMDYVFLLPFVIISAYLIHKNKVMGKVFAGMFMIKAVTLGLAIVFMGIFMMIEGQEQDMMLLVIFIIITIIATYYALKYFKNLDLKAIS